MFRGCLHYLIRGGLVLGALFCGTASGAERAQVILVIDQEHAIHDELIDSLRRGLRQQTGVETVITVASLARTPATRKFLRCIK